MSTEAQKRFAVVGAHRQLHADAAKQVARLERLINEAADPDQIVAQARELMLAQVTITLGLLGLLLGLVIFRAFVEIISKTSVFLPLKTGYNSSGE